MFLAGLNKFYNEQLYVQMNIKIMIKYLHILKEKDITIKMSIYQLENFFNPGLRAPSQDPKGPLGPPRRAREIF